VHMHMPRPPVGVMVCLTMVRRNADLMRLEGVEQGVEEEDVEEALVGRILGRAFIRISKRGTEECRLQEGGGRERRRLYTTCTNLESGRR
jgi:hypothetical protein